MNETNDMKIKNKIKTDFQKWNDNKALSSTAEENDEDEEKRNKKNGSNSPHRQHNNNNKIYGSQKQNQSNTIF